MKLSLVFAIIKSFLLDFFSMISFDINDRRFQLRAAAIIMRDDYILLHRLINDDFWALPGGRVEAGEEAASTIVRELNEELALPVRVGNLLWVAENFFPLNGKQFHEVGLYYLTTPEKDSIVLTSDGPYEGQEGNQKLVFTWFRRSEIVGMDVRPKFLVQSLAAETLQFGHFVNRD